MKKLIPILLVIYCGFLIGCHACMDVKPVNEWFDDAPPADGTVATETQTDESTTKTTKTRN